MQDGQACAAIRGAWGHRDALRGAPRCGLGWAGPRSGARGAEIAATQRGRRADAFRSSFHTECVGKEDKMRPSSWIAVVVASAGVAGSALGDDFAPPEWRGQPLTVFAEWDFATVSSPLNMQQPSMFQTVGGSGGETLHPQNPVGAIFDLNNLTYDAAQQGWTGGPGFGAIDFNLPNWIDDEPRKDVRVQLTFIDPSGMTEPLVGLIEAFDPTVPGQSFQGEFQGFTFVDSTHVYEDWVLRPNPDWEIIKVIVPPNVTLTQVVIDTISWVPAPASLALLGVASCFAWRRRR